MYATSTIAEHQTVQGNLRIYMVAKKHGLTIENIEVALTLDSKERKEYLLKEKIRND